MTQAVIAAYIRTPFQFAFKGVFAGLRPDDLAAVAVKGLIERTGVPGASIDDLLLGCAFPEGMQSGNLGRLVGLLAGLPISAPGATISRYCGSSMSAVHIAAGHIAAGAGEAFVCAGVESMTGIPNGGAHPAPNPRFVEGGDLAGLETYIGMGHTAERVADRYRVSRQRQDAFALASQQKAARAQAAGAFADELVPVPVADQVVTADGCLRPQTTLEGLAGLKPVFAQDGSVTAGTASPLTDGAAAVLVCSEAYAARHGLKPLARIRGFAAAGCAPDIMGIGPVPASQKALAMAGLSASDIDVVELNEAFASQALACIDALGLDEGRVNLDGGALALGHPLGATGARIVGKAAQLLARGEGRLALATQCIGGGQGVATVLEAI